MKNRRHIRRHIRRRAAARGFALVATLALMMLLTILALGLLTLSGAALRQARSSTEAAEARANARLALILALGDLQKQLGPDTRISAAADQLPGTTPETSGAAATRGQWTGVYDSWPAPASAGGPDPRPATSFRQWLVSGQAGDVQTRDFAKGPDRVTRELVGPGTLGTAGSPGRVSVPVVELHADGKVVSRLAWWVGDQGLKAAMSTTPPPPLSDLAAVAAGLQGAPRNAVQLATTGDHLAPFGTLADQDARLALVTDFKQLGLLASSPQAPAPLFHDLVAHSSGLLTNVRAGGFRKDLSMYLESATPPTGGFPPGNGALYQVNGCDGIRATELWSYYNLYKQLKTGSLAFTTGGSGGGTGNPYLQSEATAPLARADHWFYFKRPVIVGYKVMFSFFVTDPIITPAGKSKPASAPLPRLALCVDPVVTFWNPYDVPVSLSPAFNSIRFEKIPYQIKALKVTVNGVTTDYGDMSLGGAITQLNYVTLRAGNPSTDKNPGVPIVLKPGEVLFYSQGPGTVPVAGGSVCKFVDGKPGFGFGGGVFYPFKDPTDPDRDSIKITGGATQVTVSFGGVTPTADIITQTIVAGASVKPVVSANHAELYLFDDREEAQYTSSGIMDPLRSSIGIGGAFVDFFRGLQPSTGDKPASSRFTASQKSEVFHSTAGGTINLATNGIINDRKKWFLHYAYDLKSEADALRPGQFLSRLNPSAPLVDFADLSEAERDALPFEIHIQGNTGSASNSPLGMDCDNLGHGYIGGGLTAADGASFVTSHSVPSAPLVSLAALQYSQANGFGRDKPDKAAPAYEAVLAASTGILNNQSIRLPMLPQIAHAIGNSLAPAVLAPEMTQGELSGRPLADHSYLANQALWDDWFFSGIAPQPATGWTQLEVAERFFKDDTPLPTARYRPAAGADSAAVVVARLFAGGLPQPAATAVVASMIRVDGQFNVNSTSIQAWKAVLGGLKNHPVVTRTTSGAQAQDANPGRTPVAGLLTPTAGIAGSASVDVKDPDQWTGRRTLADAELDALANKLVAEVRKRGPFVSLADFINRRPSSNKDLARAGAVQCAIDAAGINQSYHARKAAAAASLPFGEAESGSPAAQGIAGVVKQADLLTPIAPVLSARSDSFIIRGYGEKLDRAGTTVLARACCEAVVERDREFVDSTQLPASAPATLNPVNQQFGRRLLIRSFRWLNPNEI